MWHKQGEEVVYSGYRTLLKRTYATPHGVHELEIKLEDETAVTLALTADRHIVLVREFRPGPEEWLLELPGGHVDDGEIPAAAAARELLEETGYRATPRPAGSMFDCAYSTRVATSSSPWVRSAWPTPPKGSRSCCCRSTSSVSTCAAAV